MPYYIKKKSSPGPRRRRSTSRTLTDKLDRVFSLYIRMRDSMPYRGQAFKCISCGEVKPFAQADCGHYMSRTHMATRFDEDNCHAECRACNRFSADHLVGYREHLILKLGRDECMRKQVAPTLPNVKKLGEKRIALVELHSRSVKKYSAWELEQLIDYYTILISKLQKL